MIGIQPVFGIQPGNRAKALSFEIDGKKVVVVSSMELAEWHRHQFTLDEARFVRDKLTSLIEEMMNLTRTDR